MSDRKALLLPRRSSILYDTIQEYPYPEASAYDQAHWPPTRQAENERVCDPHGALSPGPGRPGRAVCWPQTADGVRRAARWHADALAGRWPLPAICVRQEYSIRYSVRRKKGGRGRSTARRTARYRVGHEGGAAR